MWIADTLERNERVKERGWSFREVFIEGQGLKVLILKKERLSVLFESFSNNASAYVSILSPVLSNLWPYEEDDLFNWFKARYGHDWTLALILPTLIQN